jgi:hypothetical protein
MRQKPASSFTAGPDRDEAEMLAAEALHDRPDPLRERGPGDRVDYRRCACPRRRQVHPAPAAEDAMSAPRLSNPDQLHRVIYVYVVVTRCCGFVDRQEFRDPDDAKRFFRSQCDQNGDGGSVDFYVRAEQVGGPC